MNQFVEEFLADLEAFATGAYLREEDKEFWEQPYDPAAVVELRAILEGFLRGPATVARASACIEQLCAMNREYGYAVIEPEEEAELTAFFHRALAAAGVMEEEFKSLPEFE